MTRHEAFQDVPEAYRMKSHYVVKPRLDGGFIITVRRFGRKPYDIFCQTKGEANRQRLALSTAGIIGFVQGV